MPWTLTVISINPTRRKLTVLFSAVPSGAYVAGGDVVDLTAPIDSSYLGYKCPSVVPDVLECVSGMTGNSGEGVTAGLTPATCKMKFFSSTDTELAAGAYSATQLADGNIKFQAEWKGMTTRA